MPITSSKDVKEIIVTNSDEQKKHTKAKWWGEPDESMHASVFAVIDKIRQVQNYRSANYLRYARLYSNMEISSLAGGLFSRTNDAQQYMSNRATYNVIKSCIDTAASKIGKSKPRPFFLTEDGSWDLQERAKMLTKFFQGQFERMGTGSGEDRTFWGQGRQCFTDCGIFGTGSIKLFTEGDEVKSERNFIDEILVDDAEGRYRSPRQMHQVKLVFRELLFDLFPSKYHKEIAACPSGLKGDQSSQMQADMVEIAESWHLPSGDEQNDGKKFIGLRNVTLDVDDWQKDYFPFLFQRWSLYPLGFYGRGLADELIGIQLEINKLLRNIQLAQHLCAVPQVWMDVTSKIPGKKVNNEIGGIKYFRNAPPIFMTPSAMSPEVYRHLETLYQKAYEVTGISMMSATSQKPAGLDSGKAIREYKDIQTERFALVENMYEDFYMEGTSMTQDMMRDLVKEGKNPKVRVKDGHSSMEVAFKDVDIPDDKMSVRAYPTNFLPSTPAGKFQTVQELVQGGFYSQEEALDLLDFPDTAKLNRTKLAPRDAVFKVIEFNIKHAKKDGTGRFLSPEPRMNLDFAAETAQTYILRMIADGAPEHKLDVMRKFYDICESMINKAIAEQEKKAMEAQMPPAPAGMPPEAGMIPPGADPAMAMDPAMAGVPAAPPVSDLMPQG